MSVKSNVNEDISYLDLQGLAGVSKHNGGLPATKELLAMCRLQEAKEVLEVGCGIGAGATYMARTHGVRVVAVDLSEKMLEWARLRVRQEGVADQVELHQANVLDLPFEAERFDAVICESVLAFVQDKPRAIAEMLRVLKPGRYVGLNEAVWTEEPPEGLAQKAAPTGSLGAYILTAAAWRELWEASGLREPEVRVYQVDAAEEVRSRISWIGWRQILRAWGRILPLYLRKPAIRSQIKGLLDTPREWFAYLGYALLAGKKSR